jgi:hypothetical protein
MFYYHNNLKYSPCVTGECSLCGWNDDEQDRCTFPKQQIMIEKEIPKKVIRKDLSFLLLKRSPIS